MRKYGLSDFVSQFLAVIMSTGGLLLSVGGWEQASDYVVVYLTALSGGSYFFAWYFLCINNYLHEHGVHNISYVDLYDSCKPMWITMIAGAYWAGSCIWFVLT